MVDRNENAPDELENGVLTSTESLETTGLDLLGGATAQVDVALPDLSSDDDDIVDDDDVVVEIDAFDQLLSGPVIVTVDAADLPNVDERAAQETDDVAPSVEGDEAVTAEVVLDDFDAGADDHDDESEGEESVTGERENEALAAEEEVAPAEDNAVDLLPAAASAVASADRLRARTGEVALQSRRLGDFGADRETSDLLTADRLLDPARITRSEPEGGWQSFVYAISGRRINLGDSKNARARKELDRRIAAPLSGGSKFVPVLSRKGGVGKTTVTTLLGMALADARDDRVIAVDANPDRGTLADRIGRTGGKTVRDLVRSKDDIRGFNDISAIVARDETRLDILASDTDPHVSEAFSDTDYHDVAAVAEHFYSIVLTDTGTGIVHSVMEATLERADQLIIVAGLSVDEARLASETLTWLETNGFADQVRRAIVVLNTARPGAQLVRADELETHFSTRVSTVVRIPYDAHVAAGSAVTFRDLDSATREAARRLAAAVVEGLRSQSA